MSSASNSRQPQGSAFKQQQLKAWTPILTPKAVIVTLFIVGIIFIPLGVVFLVTSNGVVEARTEYSGTCFQNGVMVPSCNVQITIEKDMAQPVYFYYELDNFFQNHRRYVKSRSDEQLRGDSDPSTDDCEPAADPAAGREFCGLIANSRFNDTFRLLSPTSTEIPMTKQGIAWKSDVENKFKAGTDEDLIVWMRTAGLPKFKKLHRIINTDLPAGTYSVDINQTYPVHQFDGKKSIVLSTTKWLGGKNNFLGLAYIIVGSLCLLLAILFALKHMMSPRALGDTSYLQWNRTKAARD
eukprot:TRINITY_DN2302_c3_g2_i1.p1 TRINITY_DN2302_c3_g2~~TRINITY_DN2302_c3_g2_i1.p1  ORF type:complete len:296 (-),score=91.86 TRINITY_DN2302_c3_g2_i1:1060-1947(-)